MTRAIILALMASPASAQGLCTTPQDMVAKLSADFGETQTGAGITTKGELLALFTGPDGSWSIIVLSPDGKVACFVASGIEVKQGEPT